MIGKIAVSRANFAIDKPYSYRIPEGMTLAPGQRVSIPFGPGNKRCDGVVLAVEPGEDLSLKAVEEALDPEPILTDTQLRLAVFLRERYFCTFYEAIRAILPAVLWYQSRASFSLTEDRRWQTAAIRKPYALDILRCLDSQGGKATLDSLKTLGIAQEDLEETLGYLARKKWVNAQKEFLQRSRDKSEKIAQLAIPPEEALAFAAQRGKSAAMQKAVVELMASLGRVAVKELCYFTGASAATVKRLEALGIVKLTQKPVLRCREIPKAEISGTLALSPDQSRCCEGLLAQMGQEKPGSAVLYGVTGSGKTSVYIRLIQSCLDAGESAILMVPEIALTPQLLGLLAAYFDRQVAVLHSSLSTGERYDQWKRVRSGDAKVVVGTRSAVFAPCSPKLIILDEEQEHSYQSENTPRYCAREVALWRGMKEGALVLLGSATPSIETMYRAKTGQYRLYTLPQRFGGRALPEVEIVDMGQELRLGNDTSLSIPLRQAILETRDAGHQTVLLLNRRGNSRSLICVDCGQAPECPRCSQRLTYHSANHRLMCHYCGHSQSVPSRCPICGGPMKSAGVGTQKVEQEIKALFPDMEVARMDTDTVTPLNTHEKILGDFQKNNTPILIGTQMVAKGLNLPNVTLVGVLDADLSLYAPGYQAGETSFNMLTQVVGRAGRGDYPGRALIQTLNPQHQIIRLAAKQDYAGFYDLEIGLRRVQGAPPFGNILTVTFTGQEGGGVLRGAAKFRDSLIHCLETGDYAKNHCTVLGPAPCAVPKINYNFRYQLTLRCQMDKQLGLLLAHLIRQFRKDRMNRDVSCFIDRSGQE